jgi:gluconokinase
VPILDRGQQYSNGKLKSLAVTRIQLYGRLARSFCRENDSLDAELTIMSTMVIVLMGVAGSGKTTIGKLLAESLGWKYFDADEFHSASSIEKMKNGIPLVHADRQPWLESLQQVIRETLEKSESAVMACSALKQSYRDLLLIDERVRLVYLKGEYDLIQKRLQDRSEHFMNPQLLQSQFDALEEPTEGLHVDIESSPREIVQLIRTKLRV